MVTIEASSTTISWAMTTTARMDQRFGSSSAPLQALEEVVCSVI
jgi:hypothetical protein